MPLVIGGGSSGSGLDANRAPSDSLLKLWTADPLIYATAFAPTAGVVNLAEMSIRSAQTLTKFWWIINQALAVGGGGAANLFFGVYVQLVGGTLTLVGKTADQVAAMSGASAAPASATLTAEAGQSLALDGSKRVWGAFLIGTQGSTAFQMVRAAAGNNNVNAGMTAGTDPLRSCKSGTGQSALPATIAVSGLTTDLPVWYGAS